MQDSIHIQLDSYMPRLLPVHIAVLIIDCAGAVDSGTTEFLIIPFGGVSRAKSQFGVTPTTFVGSEGAIVLGAPPHSRLHAPLP